MLRLHIRDTFCILFCILLLQQVLQAGLLSPLKFERYIASQYIVSMSPKLARLEVPNFWVLYANNIVTSSEGDFRGIIQSADI